MEAKTSTWVGGATVVAVLLGFGGWSLAISPALTTASDTQAEALDVTARNEALERELVRLKEQHKNLDAYRGEVAAIEAQIPASAELDAFLRQVGAHAEATGAFVVSVAAAVPINFAPGEPVAPAAAAPAEGEGDAESDGSTDSAAETAAPAAAPSIDGFVAVPVDITLLGNVFNVTRMLAALQGGDQRLFMVTSFTGKGTDEEEAGEGRPATAKGDLELTVSGYLYVLKGPVVTAQDGEDAPAAPLPSGALEGNPMTGA
ncbi:hypothetical protein [Cellulomonas chengniuliangii]|uniref:Pilus assembly protein PilO n=1 Tax=Cellulomonas chengniuliangii TaxID=2968084 RepID=A0ABY5L1X4_9CELL|nr:hypothetical protein [Cellulomonas chengniuliangii]MCC2308413.1 hypothetical protein [Cellulomonas chengniuliangii]UUI76790.1 hypothetical protein NP064_07935 [Cellulomonas chengniuliangii]